RSVHASVPDKGSNPNYALVQFLHKLEQARYTLSRHELLGQTTVAPTIMEVDTKSRNVTPAWARVLLDFRTASESLHSLETFIHTLAGDWPHTITPAWHPDTPDPDETIYGFYTPPDHEVVQRTRALIAQGTGQEPELTSYNFATDGRLFVPYNIPVIGYSPAEEAQAHIAGESIAINKMRDSLHGHVALLQGY
ncbi:MAG: peptidase dimerization domain-containing protein, partial [Anaerolineales bacterium]|nr:peptidase dimerization domain-containing protein [Anaerolineales bacterium]